MDGSFASSQYFEGLDKGVVAATKLNTDIIKDTTIQSKVDAAEAKIKGGYNIFTGPLKDNTGKEVIPAGKSATDEELLSMMYFVEGVDGVIPK